MFHKLLDAFFPRESLRGISGYWITEEEWSDIPIRPYTERRPFLEERGLSYLDTLSSACNYHDSLLLQRAIHTLKYRRVPGLAYQLAHFIVQVGEKEMRRDMVITPVPLHWKRRFDRGYNQAALLAKRVASILDLPYAQYVSRNRDTGHQAWRSREERMHAVRMACTAKISEPIPTHVVLVDDIATTGATLDECARALKSAGVKTVSAWVIARG